MKITPWVLFVLLASPLGVCAASPQQSAPAAGDQQEDSVAAAARRAREQKKNDVKPAKVWDNDNVPTTGIINVIGQEPANDATAATPDASGKAPAGQAQTGSPAPASPANPPEPSKQEVAALQADSESAKQEVESLKTDLDILQRKYSLDQQSYDGNPDHASDKAGQAALDDEKGQIHAKQQELADAQKRAEDLHGKLAAASTSAPGHQDSKAPNSPTN